MYYFNVIKEVSVTDSFLTLDTNLKECQTETLNDCTSRLYNNMLINKCQCLPFQIRFNEKVRQKKVDGYKSCID